MIPKKSALLFLAAFFLNSSLTAITVDESFSDENLARSCSWANESQTPLRWTKNTFNTINLGYQNSPVHLKCDIQFTGVKASEYFLESVTPWLDLVQLLNPETGEVISIAGEAVPKDQRATSFRNAVFKLMLKPGLNQIHLRYVSQGSSYQLPIYLYSPASFLTQERLSLFGLGILFGLLGCLVVLSLIFRQISGDLLFFLFALNITISAVYLFTVYGLPGEFFSLPVSVTNAALGISITTAISGVVEFHRRYLHIFKGILSKVMKIISIVSLAGSTLFLFGLYAIGMQFANTMIILTTLTVLAILLIQFYNNKLRYSKFYIGGWIVFLACLPPYILMNYGILEANLFMRNLITYAVVIQAILFASALSSKYREMRETELQSRRELKMMETEYRHAREIHRRLLPDKIAEIQNLAVDSLYIPLRDIGGDFYTIEYLADGRVLFVLADVQGHGLPAALDASSVRLSFIEAYGISHSPGGILQEMNRLLHPHLSFRFVSALVVLWCPSNREATIACAGHPPPLKINRRAIEFIEITGPILGLTSSATYDETKVTLQKEERLLLYTDGLVEDPGVDETENAAFAFVSEFFLGNTEGKLRDMAEEMVNLRKSKVWDDDVTSLLLKSL